MLANVISISKSPRRELARKKGAEFGFEIQFFRATNYVKRATQELTSEFDFNKFYDRYGRPPSSGEIGVFMSHFALWRKLKEKGEGGAHLILEDDFLPKATAKIIDNIILSTKGDYDVIILGYSKVDKEIEGVISLMNPLNVRYTSGHYKVGKKFHESTCGALSYVVKSSFFDKVLINGLKPYYLIDDWTVFKKMGVNILHVTPLCFHEDYKNLSSSIDESGRELLIDSKNKDHGIIYRKLRHVYRKTHGLVLSMLMSLGFYSSY
jgi:glycosyl transferase family 25